MIKNGGSVIDDTSNMVRSLLSTIERKVEEEVNNRQRDLGETKDSIEQKLINMLDKMKNDERQSLERERRLMEQV
jgi:DNA-binding protein H-NS